MALTAKFPIPHFFRNNEKHLGFVHAFEQEQPPTNNGNTEKPPQLGGDFRKGNQNAPKMAPKNIEIWEEPPFWGDYTHHLYGGDTVKEISQKFGE